MTTVTLENGAIDSVSHSCANIATARTPNLRRETLAHENALVHFCNIGVSIRRPCDYLSVLKKMYCMRSRAALERSALRPGRALAGRRRLFGQPPFAHHTLEIAEVAAHLLQREGRGEEALGRVA